MKSPWAVAALTLSLLGGCAATEKLKARLTPNPDSEWSKEMRAIFTTGDRGGISSQARSIESNLGVR